MVKVSIEIRGLRLPLSRTLALGGESARCVGDYSAEYGVGSAIRAPSPSPVA
jgi:hypothetical protein